MVRGFEDAVRRRTESRRPATARPRRRCLPAARSTHRRSRSSITIESSLRTRWRSQSGGGGCHTRRSAPPIVHRSPAVESAPRAMAGPGVVPQRSAAAAWPGTGIASKIDGAKSSTTAAAPPMWSGSPWVSTSRSSRPVPRAHSDGRHDALADVEAHRLRAGRRHRRASGRRWETPPASRRPARRRARRPAAVRRARQGHRHVDGAATIQIAHAAATAAPPRRRLRRPTSAPLRAGVARRPPRARPSRYEAATQTAGAGIRSASHGNHSTRSALAASPPAAHAVTRPKALAAAGRHGMREHGERGRHLHDRHQRHSRQVEQQAGDGDAVEEGRRHRQQHQFSRQRRRHHASAVRRQTLPAWCGPLAWRGR